MKVLKTFFYWTKFSVSFINTCTEFLVSYKNTSTKRAPWLQIYFQATGLLKWLIIMYTNNSKVITGTDFIPLSLSSLYFTDDIISFCLTNASFEAQVSKYSMQNTTCNLKLASACFLYCLTSKGIYLTRMQPGHDKTCV